LTVTKVYKCRSEIWDPFPKKFGGSKTSKFWRDFGQLRDLIANISRMEQDIVDQKTALQTAITPIEHTKYGELWSTNGEK